MQKMYITAVELDWIDNLAQGSVGLKAVSPPNAADILSHLRFAQSCAATSTEGSTDSAERSSYVQQKILSVALAARIGAERPLFVLSHHHHHLALLLIFFFIIRGIPFHLSFA